MTTDPLLAESPASAGQERAVQRICVRVAGPVVGAGVHVASLPLGGLEVWLDSPPHRWRYHHRMARELRLAGWHTETGPDRLLLLGWSAVYLSHRARMLSAALAGRLADFDKTAFMAVMIATRLLHEGFPAENLPVEVAARCGDALRWPARLADLDGLERRSSLEPLRLRLAQVAGLEAKVSRRCGEHLALACKVARAVAGGAVPSGPRARHATPYSSEGPSTLTERMVCVSVPNVAAKEPVTP
ncbi:hypothetical protein FH608_046835 [Nonomuraea phyllanthi]|uniref:Uncharacterized protein n=1 Tax=Nonomuraea phyllanthi TaxID=2219224 RepID=A0A5C4V4M0_9ACTN|nr:hypothetical protein [Nonomuraea phyllanthi]KAB8186244.1 hypothetical protein FH608_046835 [Nonomuraea phyllanthi]QFY11572.1 hypothetical protein GBF35_37815 [Nonomuraea phyllanthi]